MTETKKEFEIGDKVKIVNAENSLYNVGDVGVVIEDPDDWTDVMQSVCVLVERYGFEQIFEAHQLELVNE